MDACTITFFFIKQTNYFPLYLISLSFEGTTFKHQNQYTNKAYSFAV